MSSINPLNDPYLNLTTPTAPIPISGSISTSDSIAQATANLQALFPKGPVLPIAKYYNAVSSSLREQKLQEIIAKFADASTRKELFAAASNEARQISDLLSEAQTYDTLQANLEALNIDQHVTDVNSAIDTYNNGEDPSQTTLLNQAIDNYDSAEQIYRSALSFYSTDLANYENARSVYESAVSDWNDALEQYLIDGNQTTLDAAKATFDTAQSTFDSAQADFDNQKASFEVTQNSLDAARSQLDAQILTYNAYVDLRNADAATLNTALQNWNQTASDATNILNQLNVLRDQLSLNPPLNLPPLSQLVGLQNHYTLPNATPDPLKDGVQTSIHGINGSINTLNDFITNTVNPNIVSANATADPDYSLLTTLSNIDDLTTLSAHLSPLTNVPPQTNYPHVIYTAPPHIEILDLISTTVVTLGVAIEIALKQDSSNELDETPFAKRIRKAGLENFLGGSGASTALTTLDQTASANNPYLGSVLSRQAFEAFFNVFGVPIGSMLVDQVGAQVRTFRSRVNLIATAPAQQILGGARINSAQDQESVRLALGLGTIREILNLDDSGIRKNALRDIFIQSPEFRALPPEKQDGLLKSLSKEITAGELKESLPSLGPRFAGLLPQILLAVETPTGNEDMVSIRSFLFEIVNLAKGIAQTFGLPIDQAQDLAKKSYLDSLAKTGETSKQSIIDAIVKNIDKSNSDRSETNRKADLAYENGQREARAQASKESDARRDAFAASFTNSLASKNIIDSTQAQRLQQQFQNTPENDLGKIALDAARRFNLDTADLKEILTKAEKVRQARLSALNPIGSFVLHHIAPPGELAIAFVKQAQEVLTPTIGPAKASQVAAEYSDLLFKGANSVIGRLQNHEQELNQAVTINQNDRLFEDYRRATDSLRSPDTAEGSPRNLGAVLLMTAMAAGPGSAGTTSEDNALGPLANRNKRPIDIPI